MKHPTANAGVAKRTCASAASVLLRVLAAGPRLRQQHLVAARARRQHAQRQQPGARHGRAAPVGADALPRRPISDSTSRMVYLECVGAHLHDGLRAAELHDGGALRDAAAVTTYILSKRARPAPPGAHADRRSGPQHRHTRRRLGGQEPAPHTQHEYAPRHTL